MKRTVAAVTGAVCLVVAILVSNGRSAALDAPQDFDPPAFTSSNHLLDVLVIAEPKTISLGEFHPTAWAFKICETAVAQHDECPPDARTFAPANYNTTLHQTPIPHPRT